MAKNSGQQPKKSAKPLEEIRRYRNFPKHSIESSLVLPQKIQDEMGGKPMNRLLLADALGLSPSSSNFRELLSSSYKYGFTEGTEKASEISLTSVGEDATQNSDKSKRLRALRTAALRSPVFGQFFRDYANKKVPSSEMLPKILSSQYEVAADLTAECAGLLSANGKLVEIIRDIGGSPHILLDAELAQLASNGNPGMSVNPSTTEPSADLIAPTLPPPLPLLAESRPTGLSQGPKPIFVGHGKNKAPLQQLQKLLATFQIPHKVVVDEANLGRPISQKVKDTIERVWVSDLNFHAR